jgi:hypothetical protein
VTIHRLRRARVRHACGRCVDVIEPGALYWSCSLPPGSDIGNTGWWHEKSHHLPGCLDWGMRPGMVEHGEVGLR